MLYKNNFTRSLFISTSVHEKVLNKTQVSFPITTLENLNCQTSNIAVFINLGNFCLEHML